MHDSWMPAHAIRPFAIAAIFFLKPWLAQILLAISAMQSSQGSKLSHCMQDDAESLGLQRIGPLTNNMRGKHTTRHVSLLEVLRAEH